MVRCVDNSEFKRLVEIAEQMVGSDHVRPDYDLDIVKIHDSKLRVCGSNLYVSDECQEDLATDLARRYEGEFGREFEVRRQY